MSYEHCAINIIKLIVFTFFPLKITFDVGESFAFFTIKVMNDFCSEVNMEYVQLYLHIPGGGPIHGEHYRAQLRIDDDDWLGESTSLNCTNGIS